MNLLIDGAPPTLEDLTQLALVNYGAYTSFRVDAGGVLGLDLHLERLHIAAIELFGRPVAESRLREFMRQALDGRSDAWMRVSLFSRDIWPRTPSAQGEPSVMASVSPPPPPLAATLRLQVQTHAREAAHLKHAGTFGLIRARRLAREAGFDDALFADGEGWVSEGSSWNIGFFDGDTVVWPEAPMLKGVAQALIEQGLDAKGLGSVTRPVRIDEIAAFDGAFICNSATPACAVPSVGEVAFDIDPARIEAVARAWASATPQPI